MRRRDSEPVYSRPGTGRIVTNPTFVVVRAAKLSVGLVIAEIEGRICDADPLSW